MDYLKKKCFWLLLTNNLIKMVFQVKKFGEKFLGPKGSDS